MKIELQPRKVQLRHIKMGTGDGSQTLLGKTFVPSWDGLNDERGFQSGSYERRIGDHGLATVVFPNAMGSDQIHHRDRFLIIANGSPSDPRPLTFDGGGYRPGDEWIEIWAGDDLLFVGTPYTAQLTRGQIQLTLGDGFWLLKKSRESASGFWTHAPQDVISHYSSLPRVISANSFDSTYTYSTAIAQIDSQGWWYVGGESLANYPSTINLRAANPGFAFLYSPPGTGLSGVHYNHRFVIEGELMIDTTLDASNTVGIGLLDGASTIRVGLYLTETQVIMVSSGVTNIAVKREVVRPGPFAMRVECRERWTYYYLNGKLVGVMPTPQVTLTDALACVQLVQVGGVVANVRVSRMRFQVFSEFLQANGDAGDRAIGGTPVEDGLVGEWFTNPDVTTDGVADRYRNLMKPPATPYRRRLQSQLYLAASDWPAGTANLPTARFTGAIYLPLDAADYRFQFDYLKLAQRYRMWIGKTRFKDPLIDHWDDVDVPGGSGTTETPWLRTHLGVSVAGWYPIVLEIGNPDTALTIRWQTSLDATWRIVGDLSQSTRPKLASVGTFNDTLRNESQFDGIQSAAARFALQVTCDPRSLESGEFPGHLTVARRIGRDTDKVLDSVEGTDIQTTIHADEVADQLVADGAGLGDPETTVQAEMVNEGEWLSHPFLAQEAESLPDVSSTDQLQQRLSTLLVLHGSPWEEVNARPLGHKEMCDSFAMTGALAAFDWSVGDGVRLDLPEVAVVDQYPRQILGFQRDFVPGGLKPPVVSFRQRPRSAKDTLRAIYKHSLAAKRNYQSQLAVVSGPYAIAPATGAYDDLSLVPITNIDDVVAATLRVVQKSDGSTWTIYVNGVSTGIPVKGVGDIDLTGFIAVASGQQMYARPVGGTGTVAFLLELTVRI